MERGVIACLWVDVSVRFDRESVSARISHRGNSTMSASLPGRFPASGLEAVTLLV